MQGGEIVARVLKEEKVPFLFTLIGGHISPIIVSSKQSGIRVIDTRHEVNAVFAADAVARLTGIPGVAAVTAGPGITNTITAVKNAYLAQSPIVLLGGAAPTLLKGRGALQDIDQIELMQPNVKWAAAVRSVRDIYPTLKKAFQMAMDGVPGPVFVELPLDLLYEESIVRSGFEKSLRKPSNLKQIITNWYIQRHLNNVFKSSAIAAQGPATSDIRTPSREDVTSAVAMIETAQRPVLLVGSGAMMVPADATSIAGSLATLGIPTFLSGMARGLLGKDQAVQYRHHRKEALREADLVLLAGVPFDFRLEYGQHVHSKAKVISINRSRADLYKNRRPTLAVQADPGKFLISLGARGLGNKAEWKLWHETLGGREHEREKSIRETGVTAAGLHPVQLFLELDKALTDKSIIVADGGDFVGTASYVLKPRKHLSWLDPGVFGTLGIGGGFALGGKLCLPESELYIIYGDGSAGYSLMEFDTYVRHKLPVIAIIGNDASWAQIARDQVEILGDDVGTKLAHSDYEKIAHAFGGRGRKVNSLSEFQTALLEARASIREGIPYLINAVLAQSDFRKGSLSM